MIRPLYIAFVELNRYVRDRGALALGIALPIVIFAVMYGAFGGETAFNGTAHIADLDPGPKSDELIDRLSQVQGLDIAFYTESEMDDALSRSAVTLGAIIPADFSKSLDAGEPTSITFRRRGSGGDEGQIAASIIRGAAQEIADEALIRSVMNRALPDLAATPDAVDTAIDAILAQSADSPPVAVRTQIIGEGEQDVILLFLPGILVMFLMFTMMLGSASIVEDRRIGILERLLTTRLSINQLFIGKFISFVVIAAFQTFILLGLAFVVLRPAGPTVFAQMVAFSIFVSLALSAIGLVIAGVAKTQDQASWYGVSFTLYMSVFGGAFFDASASSGPLEFLSRFTVSRYAIDALRSIASGAETIFDQSLEIAVLGAVAALGLTAARLLFRVAEGGR